MASNQIPVPNGLVSFWRTQPHILDDHRSTPDLPCDTDIVVIGSGYAGVSTVHHILKETKGQTPRIVILEARQACSGATGRNG